MIRSATIRVSVVILSMYASAARALEIDVRAGYQAEYTDNVAETANNEDSTWIQTPQIALLAKEDGAF